MTKRGCVLVALFALGLLCSPAWGQGGSDAKPIFTYVAQWGVPRAMWGDVEKMNEDNKTIMDGLVADGTLLGYGTFNNRVHSDGGYTHGSWFQAASLGNLFKALESIYARPGRVTSPVQAESKHQDYVMISTIYGFKPANNATGYLRVISAQFKPGHEDEFMAAYTRYIRPVYDKLLADGTIIAYQFDTEFNIQNAPGRFFSVIVTPDADAMDKVQAAFGEVFGKNPAILDALVGNLVPQSRQDLLARVTNVTHK